MIAKKRVWFSHTGLESLNRCPKCFFLQYKYGIRQPEGIVSRLANRFDGVIKKYFDLYRQSGELPPMVSNQITNLRLQNPFIEKYWVNFNENYGFWGKLDECFIDEDGCHIPVDFKTASSDPRGKETLPAYQTQIDDYLYLLKNNRKKIAGYGYLIYIYPVDGNNLHDGWPMLTHIVKVNGDPEKTIERINKAIETIQKDIAQPSPNCPFCSYISQLNNINT